MLRQLPLEVGLMHHLGTNTDEHLGSFSRKQSYSMSKFLTFAPRLDNALIQSIDLPTLLSVLQLQLLSSCVTLPGHVITTD